LADPPEGLGTIESGGRADGFGVGFGVAKRFFSLTVTLIFCPGFKFSRPNFAPEPDVDGLMASGFGVGLTDCDGVGLTDCDGDGFTDGFGDGFTDGFGDGFTDGFGDGFTDGFGVGFGAGLAGFTGVFPLSEDGTVDVSAGGTFGVTGFGVTGVEVSEFGWVDGALEAGAEPLGAGAVTTKRICSGITGALICEGADIPTEVTVATVNV
jgi:hypothetical protein